MHTFLFSGVDQHGRQKTGQLGALDETDLEKRLRDQGVWLVDARKARRGSTLIRRGEGASRRALTQFCTLMAFQTRVGIPLATALETVAHDGESRAFAGLVKELKRRVESGESLADAMEMYPRGFGTNFVQLIRAGERGGSLPESFLQLKAHFEWQDRVASEVKQATIYPLVVLLATVVFIGILFTFVVPKFVTLLGAVKVPLPAPTRLVFAASGFVRHEAARGAVVLGLGSGVLAWASRRSATVARQLDRARLGLPLVGPLVRLIVLTRFAHNLALLYRNGVSLPSALELVGRVVGSRLVADAVSDLRRCVLQGTTLSDAMRRHALFPGLLIRLTVVGERTGQLDEALEQVAGYYNELLPRRVKQLLGLLEPALILGLVGIVGFVALAVILPVLSLMQSLR
ncbi:MAG TPA: type II secretion system F family protein [Verrucomicrobiota bacterium]|nr:hypothetical protein [Verrucomicrobiales bacterium]HRI13898.1 type II secretion system F family protein [Verrucomicrobiota bacterium]